MATIKPKSGDSQVTENRLGPTLRVMAVGAQTTVATFVLVVRPVASYAGPVDIRKRVALMASSTAQAVMHAC